MQRQINCCLFYLKTRVRGKAVVQAQAVCGIRVSLRAQVQAVSQLDGRKRRGSERGPTELSSFFSREARGGDCWVGCNGLTGHCNWCPPVRGSTEGMCCRQGWRGNGCSGKLGGQSNPMCVSTGCEPSPHDRYGKDCLLL